MSRGRHAMPLELADFPVDELRLGGALSYSGRTLEVDERSSWRSLHGILGFSPPGSTSCAPASGCV